jgi:ubiquinone biosynthesis protein
VRLLQLIAAGHEIWMARGLACEADVLVNEIEALGGIWPKVGQLLAQRRDALPKRFCDALAVLLQRKTSKGIRASIGYVVRRGDRAIKRRRPDVADRVQADLRLLHRLAGLRVLRVFRVVRQLRLREFVAEVTQVMTEELDFRYEAARQHEARRRWRDHRSIYVPYVYLSECREDRLVTEWIDGPTIATLLAGGRAARRLARYGWTKLVVAKRLLMSQLRQMFEDNFFHGDLHLGNIMLRWRQVVLVDFGTTGTTDENFLNRFRLLIAALVGREFAKAARLMSLLCQGLQPWLRLPFLPNRRLARLRRALAREMQQWADRTLVAGLPYAARSFNALTDALMAIVMKAGGTLEWAWFRIQRAMSTLDGTLQVFWPTLDYLKVSRKYLKRMLARTSLQPFSLPAVANQFLQLLQRGDEQTRIMMADLQVDGLLKGLE